jgi:sulfite exporter TauE/SafE
MCGGITTMLTSALPQAEASNNPPSKVLLVFCYNFGRIASYSLLGAIVGFTSSIAAKNIGVPIAGLRIVAALFLILLGLYLGQWLMWLNRIEAVGKHLWKVISPLSKHVIPVDTPTKALSLGALWGWLPCGLVYSTLTWALASGDPLTGASIMLFFGLGTLPALFTLSFGFISVKNLLVNKTFRKFMAITIILYGLYSLLVAYRLMF